jgi:hypothetical protein
MNPTPPLTQPSPPAKPESVAEKKASMDAIVNPNTSPATIVLDNKDDSRRHGRAADHLAYETMTTSKDVLTNLNVLSNKIGDDFNTIHRSIEASRASVGGLVTESGFRNLEQFGLIGVQAQKIGGELTTQVTLLAKDSIIDSAKNASAAMLLAVQNQAASMAALAECCCEIKEKITSDGDSTRTLINSIHTNSLERQLSDAKNALSGLQQSQGIVNTLLDKLVK